MSITVGEVSVLAFVLSVAVQDLVWRRIPHWCTGSALILGLGYHCFSGNLASSLIAGLLGFLLGIALFALSAVGGGDVMLLSALGAVLGLHTWIRALLLTLIIAGALALVGVLRRGIARQTFANMNAIIRHVVRFGWKRHPDINLPAMPHGVRVPFGMAAALGTIAAVLWV
jgi:prepilin peptidase CpaA